MGLKGHRNTKKQGDVGLGVAIGWFSSAGYTVSIPLTDSQDYDLIVDLDGKLQRVQVKTTTYKRRGCYQVSLTVKGGNRSAIGKLKKFDTSSVDLIFVMTADDGIYVIPSKNLGQSITLNANLNEYKVR